MVIVVVVLLVVPLAPRSSSAQGWDPARYDELVVECEAFLDRVRATLEAGDARMAAVFLDLGWESCSQMRRLVRVRWAEMTPAERVTALPEVFASDLVLAELFVAVGDCDRGASVLAEGFQLADELPAEQVEEAARASHAVLRCLPEGGLEEDRRVALGGENTDAWLMGELWGFVFRSEIFPDCPGRFPYPPSYRVRVLEAGQLRSELQADGEWRLAFEQGGRIHCGSGGAGLWVVETAAEPGDWNVYIGYAGARPPVDRAYGIAFGLRPVGAPATGPSHGIARLDAESRFASLRGHTLGAVSASDRFGPACGGFVAEAPNHRLELAVEGEVVVRLTSAMSDELSLALAGSATNVCVAPSGEGDTELRLELAAGAYDVFVAEPSPWGTGYEIRFELESDEPPPPRLGALTLPADGVAHVFEGAVPQSPLAAARPDCPGLFRPAPEVSFELTESGEWGIMVESAADTSLALVGPDGTLCSGDWAGDNPGVFRPLRPGTYHVFVGSEGAAGYGRFTLQIMRD